MTAFYGKDNVDFEAIEERSPRFGENVQNLGLHALTYFLRLLSVT